MEINDIPQDNSKIFRGQHKVVYATKDGNYQTATTNGWETEEFAILLYVPLPLRPHRSFPSYRLLAMANQTTL